MLDHNNVIKDINKIFNIFFSSPSFFRLNAATQNKFRYITEGNHTSKAINNHGNDREEINVIYWFDDFWIYSEITFHGKVAFITFSVFQGSSSDNIKHQLFRAEWDDFQNKDEKHPQPHWHITANQAMEKTFEEIAIMDQSDIFVNLLKEEKSKIIDINKIHFAMSGNWINSESHIHQIDKEIKIVNWFQGLISHLKIQLEYVK